MIHWEIIKCGADPPVIAAGLDPQRLIFFLDKDNPDAEFQRPNRGADSCDSCANDKDRMVIRVVCLQHSAFHCTVNKELPPDHLISDGNREHLAPDRKNTRADLVCVEDWIEHKATRRRQQRPQEASPLKGPQAGTAVGVWRVAWACRSPVIVVVAWKKVYGQLPDWTGAR